METVMTKWLRRKNTDYWQKGIEKLIQRCEKCLYCGVEKEWDSITIECECYWS